MEGTCAGRSPQVTLLPISSISIQLIAAQREAFGGRLVAVVRSSLAFGLMRMAGFRAEDLGLEAQACRDYDSAVAWVLSGAPASECE